MHTLLFLDPGHFHAALTLRAANPRLHPTVHVYAPPGPDLDAFLAYVGAFNERPEAPTAWDVRIHAGEDALDRLIDERRGEAVVLAGRNGTKLATIRRLHEAGLAVLADKPWLTTGDALPDLDHVTAGPPLALDIMTGRHDVVARLRRRIVARESLFGAFAANSRPSIDVGSVHHLFKIVDGRPLKRPTWYYDVAVQGDGLVDIQSHMTDQVQWMVNPESTADAASDVVIDGARRWATEVPPALFEDSTGASSFPSAVGTAVRDGVLHLACNGEIDYRLCGIRIRQRAEWRPREPEGGGDLHSALVRGTDADIIVRQGPETDYVAEIHLRAADDRRLERRLTEVVNEWQVDFLGLAIARSDSGFELVLPTDLRSGHESHFADVLDGFLDHLDGGHWPAEEARRIRTRYALLAGARDAAEDVDPARGVTQDVDPARDVAQDVDPE